jgi:hypothetical protein
MIISIDWLWTGAQGEMGLPVDLANLGIADSYKTILEDIGRINGWLLLGLLNRDPPGHRFHVGLHRFPGLGRHGRI